MLRIVTLCRSELSTLTHCFTSSPVVDVVVVVAAFFTFGTVSYAFVPPPFFFFLLFINPRLPVT